MKRVILGIFYAILFLTVGIIICLSVSKPQNNLIPWQMAVGTVVFTAFFACVAFFWSKLADKRSACKSNMVRIIILLAGGILLFILGMSYAGNLSFSLEDYRIVYISATEMATTGEISYPQYFLTYGNNIRPMLLLSLFFKLGLKSGIGAYYVTLAVSVLTLLLAIWAIGELIGKDSDFGIPATVFIIICLPIYIFTHSFYTDTMSFGLGIISLALFKKAMAKEKRWQLLVILATFFVTYGALWKITSVIPVVAACIAIFVSKIKVDKKKVLLAVVSAVVFAVAMNIWSNSYSVYKEAKKTSNPLSSWIAIGMVGDGSWNAGYDFVHELNELPTKEQKQAFSMEFIKSHTDEAFSADHLSSKLVRNFAGGTFGAKEYISETGDGTFLWNLMSPWGKFYWRSSQYCFIYVFLIYTLMFIGSIVAVIDLARGKDIPMVKVITDISFFGIFLFLMLWESNHRQMYNQLPVLVVNLFANTEYLLGKVRKRKVEKQV